MKPTTLTDPTRLLLRAAAFLFAAKCAFLMATSYSQLAPQPPPRLPLVVSPGVELSAPLPEPAWKGGAMVKLGDGRVMLAYGEKEVREPIGTSSLRAVYSSDGGRTWGGARHLISAPDYNPGRPTFLRTRRDVLWLIYFGYSRANDSTGSGRCDLWVMSSNDDGQTWNDPRRLFKGYHAGQRGAIETSDGRLVIVFSHAAEGEERDVSTAVVSTDQGRTWHKSNIVELPGGGDHSGALEPTVAELKDGRLWMLIRHGGFFHQSFSRDGGMTWGPPTPTPLTAPYPSSGSPASLIRLSDGRLAATWNPHTPVPLNPHRWERSGRDTLVVAASSDEGRTWSPPVTVARASHIAYPHLLEVEPGMLLLSTGFFRAVGYNTDVVVMRLKVSAFLP
jgi:hypothetical protein